MLGMIRAYRARKSVLQLIRPLIEEAQRAFGPISDADWRSPFCLGFMALLITRASEFRVGSLGEANLAWVQASGWSGLSGLDASDFGSELAYLSSTQDAEFAAGMQSAEEFWSAIATSRAVLWRADLEHSIGLGERLDMKSDFAALLHKHLIHRRSANAF